MSRNSGKSQLQFKPNEYLFIAHIKKILHASKSTINYQYLTKMGIERMRVEFQNNTIEYIFGFIISNNLLIIYQKR